MKSLRKLLLAVPIMFTLGCPPIMTPIPIVPNTNNPPVANLSVSPLSGYASLETKTLKTDISLTGTDPDGDAITGYKVKIDIKDDGTIDEIIPADGSFSPNPINITRDFEVGKVRIYGQCRDEQKSNSNKISTLVLIDEPSTNKLPTSNFSISQKSGQYPFTSNISLIGTDSDGTIAESTLEIDLGSDGTIDERISNNSDSVSTSKTWGFENIGSVTIRAIVKDNQNGKNIQSESITINGRTDLNGNVTSGKVDSDGNVNPIFAKMDYLSFFGEVKNDSGKKIIGKSLECKLIMQGEEKAKFEKTFSGMDIPLSNGNSLIFDYNEEGVKCSSLSPFRVSTEKYQFKDTGDYEMEIIVKYLMDNVEYKQKFISNPFEVK